MGACRHKILLFQNFYNIFIKTWKWLLLDPQTQSQKSNHFILFRREHSNLFFPQFFMTFYFLVLINSLGTEKKIFFNFFTWPHRRFNQNFISIFLFAHNITNFCHFKTHSFYKSKLLKCKIFDFSIFLKFFFGTFRLTANFHGDKKNLRSLERRI